MFNMSSVYKLHPTKREISSGESAIRGTCRLPKDSPLLNPQVMDSVNVIFMWTFSLA